MIFSSFFFFSSRRRHTRLTCDWSSDVCSSDLGLLAPRERNKTLTALAGAEPVTGSKLPPVQRLQFFLSESVWEPEAVNARRLELLRADPVTAPHGGGVLIIDDSGDRKDGTRTAHVGRQYLGRYGKTDS